MWSLHKVFRSVWFMTLILLPLVSMGISQCILKSYTMTFETMTSRQILNAFRGKKTKTPLLSSSWFHVTRMCIYVHTHTFQLSYVRSWQCANEKAVKLRLLIINMLVQFGKIWKMRIQILYVSSLNSNVLQTWRKKEAK